MHFVFLLSIFLLVKMSGCHTIVTIGAYFRTVVRIVNGVSSEWIFQWVQQAYCHYFYLSRCTMLVEMDRSSELNDNANLYDTISLRSNTWCTLFMLSESIKWVGLNPWLHIASLVLDKWNRKWSISIHFWRQINAHRSSVHIIIIYIAEWSTATVSSIDLHNMCWGWCGIWFFFSSRSFRISGSIETENCHPNLVYFQRKRKKRIFAALSQRQIKKKCKYFIHESWQYWKNIYSLFRNWNKFPISIWLHASRAHSSPESILFIYIFRICQTPDWMNRTRARGDCFNNVCVLLLLY